MWNPKTIDTDQVLYKAIADAIERDISKGILKPGDLMPPQRKLAEVIGVNLTTISRAYDEAKKRNLIVGEKGSGTYVNDDSMSSSKSLNILDAEENIMELGLIGSVQTNAKEISQVIKSVAEKSYLADLLDYAPSVGLSHHRRKACEWLRKYGLDISMDQVVICAGAMNAINCSMISIFSQGDIIAVDEYTFTGFKNIAQFNGMHLEAIEMDKEGMIPESLDQICQKKNIKGVYLMPNRQNPTASQMSMKRKLEISEVIKKHGIILIEDDIYNFTNNKEKSALSAHMPEQSVYIAGLSKSLAPGLRVAFVSVPKKYFQVYSQALSNTVMMASPFNVEVAIELIENGLYQKIVEQKNAETKKRLKIAKDILKGYDMQAADSGAYMWLKLPEGWTGIEFEARALVQGVRVLSSNKFHVGLKKPEEAIRISLNYVRTDEELVVGLNKIVEILQMNPKIITSVL